MKPTWQNVADILHSLAVESQRDWGCGFPSAGAVPGAELDAECDEWARKLADDLSEPLEPPPRVRPWLLARLATAAAAARSEVSHGIEFEHAKLSPEFFRRILIDEWHGFLRQQWQRSDGSEDFFSA